MSCQNLLKSGKNKGNVCGRTNCKYHNKEVLTCDCGCEKIQRKVKCRGSDCDKVGCDSCFEHCDYFNAYFCEDCGGCFSTCSGCEKSACEQKARKLNYQVCYHCDEVFCESCLEDGGLDEEELNEWVEHCNDKDTICVPCYEYMLEEEEEEEDEDEEKDEPKIDLRQKLDKLMVERDGLVNRLEHEVNEGMGVILNQIIDDIFILKTERENPLSFKEEEKD